MKYAIMFAIFVLAPITGELIALMIRKHYFEKENEKRVMSLTSLRKDVIQRRNFWKAKCADDPYVKGRYDSCAALLYDIENEINKGGSKC